MNKIFKEFTKEKTKGEIIMRKNCLHHLSDFEEYIEYDEVILEEIRFIENFGYIIENTVRNTDMEMDTF